MHGDPMHPAWPNDGERRRHSAPVGGPLPGTTRVARIVKRLLVLVVTLAACGSADAQSLAELSRQVRAERARLAGQARPDGSSELTKTVLTDADLFVYTTEPRPARYERDFIFVPTRIPRVPREPVQRSASSIRDWNDRLDEWRRERTFGWTYWAPFVGHAQFVNPLGRGGGARRSSRRSDRDDAGLVQPAPEPERYVPPVTSQAPHIQRCLGGGGTWANTRCLP